MKVPNRGFRKPFDKYTKRTHFNNLDTIVTKP